MQKFLIPFLFMTLLSFAQSKMEMKQRINSGKFQGIINRIDSFPTKFISPRTVDIWLPSDYSKSKKYSVIYMHDGQMLFDATTTWNKQEWRIDDVITKLSVENKIENVIVVAIWNIPTLRHNDLFPKKPLENLTRKQHDLILEKAKKFGYTFTFEAVNSDNYLKFIVEELKPFVDQKYATLTDAKHTSIGGSSMGGLISLYAICEYPKIFGAAMCLSTHWPGIFESADNPFPIAFENYLTLNLPPPTTHQIYFDYGTATLDAIYEPYQLQINQIFQRNGYQPHQFKCNKYDGAEHTENAWSARLNDPILFLFKTHSRN